MAERGASWIQKTLLGVAVAALLGLGAWNLKATHELRVEFSGVTQIVMAQKEAGTLREKHTDDALKRIEDKLALYDTKLLTVEEFRLRLALVEAKLKDIEAQLIDARGRLIALEAFAKKP